MVFIATVNRLLPFVLMVVGKAFEIIVGESIQ